MYSPKISQELIPKLYQLSKAYKKPMTKVIDEILREYLNKVEIKEESSIRDETRPVLDTIYKIVKNGN